MTSYRLAVPLICAGVLAIPAHAAQFDITESTIATTQRAISEHRISCHQLIDEYLERIRAYDQSTRLNSLILVNPKALAEADQFDAEFKFTQKIHGLQCIGEKSPAGDNSQVLSPQTGFPAITVPMGYTHGELPAGLTFLGDSFDEGTLIKFAYAYELATKHRHPPPLFPRLN